MDTSELKRCSVLAAVEMDWRTQGLEEDLSFAHKTAALLEELYKRARWDPVISRTLATAFDVKTWEDLDYSVPQFVAKTRGMLVFPQSVSKEDWKNLMHAFVRIGDSCVWESPLRRMVA